MPIPHWPNQDQPREKLLQNGADSLTDAELIAILFRTGSRGKSALDLAKELLAQHLDLKKLLLAPKHKIIGNNGIGKAKYTALKAAIELGKRYLTEDIRPMTVLNNSRHTQTFIATKLRHHVNEVFACLFMDIHFRLLAFEELFYGTINEASIYPREIVRRGLQHNAAKVILAHNHPSGNPAPSKADKQITEMIKQAVQLIDIEVIDHIIVGHHECYSFVEHGW